MQKEKFDKKELIARYNDFKKKFEYQQTSSETKSYDTFSYNTCRNSSDSSSESNFSNIFQKCNFYSAFNRMERRWLERNIKQIR